MSQIGSLSVIHQFHIKSRETGLYDQRIVNSDCSRDSIGRYPRIHLLRAHSIEGV